MKSGVKPLKSMIFYDRVFIFLSVLSGTVQRVRGFLYFRAASQKLFRRKFMRNFCGTAREAFPAEAIFLRRNSVGVGVLDNP